MANQNKITENVSVFYVKKNAKTDANQPISRSRKTLPKRYILSVFELVTYKKRENGCKALYIGKQKEITRNVYDECFIVSQEPQGKKRKNSCIWISFLDTKMLKLRNNTLNWEYRTTLRYACILTVFHILSYQNPKLHAKLALCVKNK